MVQAAATFRKSGFNDQDAATLSEVAAVFQNVADTALSADDAAASIISQLRAYGETADWATHVVDAYNEVANTQAVGTNDLATAMEVASAAMATYGNEFEQVLGLATAGVEVMQGRPAQVARGLSTIAARIVKNQEALAEYGITVEDANENLKSTYDVLAELKPKWDEMTDAQRTALGDTIAGTNQYKVLASVMSNFDSAVTATATAYNSAGSAAQENSRYMESLEAQTNQLKSTFQDFANNVITKEMISSVLNLANAFLELLKTPFGQFATRVVLVTTALTGLQGVLKGYMAFMKGGSLIQPLLAFFKVAGPGVTIVERFGAALSQIPGWVGPAIPIFIALAAAIKAGTAKFDAYNDAVNKTAEEQSKLFSYKDELADLESRTDTLTEAERHRLEVLREITAEQEKQVQAAKQAEYEAYSEAYGSGAGVATGTTGTGSGGIGGWGRVESVQRDVYQLTEYQRQLNDLQEQYTNQTAESAMSTGEYYAALQNLNDGYADNVDKLRDFIEAGIEVTDSERELVLAYDEAQVALGNVGQSVQIVQDAYNQLTNSGEISKSTWQMLIAYYPQLADGAVQTANGYRIEQSALENLMSAEQRQQAQIQNVVNGLISEAQQAGYTGQALYNLVAAQINASNTGLNFSQQMSALQALALQAGYTMQAINAVFNAGGKVAKYQLDRWDEQTVKGLMQTKGMTRSQAEAEVIRRKWGSLTSNYQPTTSPVNVPKVTTPTVSTPSRTGTTSGSTYDDSKRSEAQAQIKQLQAQQDVIQDKIDAVNEKYDAQLKELEDINDALEEQIQLQKLLQALTEAKASKKMVFKDGRFQYLSDVDAIAKAQSNLEDFYKEQELKKQKKRIEEERQAELAGLNAEKEILQKRIKEWQNFLSSMSGNYSAGLSDLSSYVNNWNSYVDSMKQPSVSTGGSNGGNTGGGSTGGGASSGEQKEEDRFQKDWNKKISGQYPSKAYSTAHNSEYNASTTKKLQSWYGTSADGIWGKNSYAAAGNRNIDAAYGLYARVKNTYGSFAAFKKAGGYATGTLSAQSGISMVGEQGPELRVLNKGDGIIPAKQTATLWSFANDPTKFLQNLNNIGGKTDIFNIANVSLPNVQNPQEFISGLRNLAYQRTYKPNFGTV